MNYSERFYMVLDTETTGLRTISDAEALKSPSSIFSHGDEVCQIGGIFLTQQMQPFRFFCYYCDVVRADSSPGALATHGIAMCDVRKYIAGQYLPEIVQKYLPELLAPNVGFIGYNTEFDMCSIRQTLANSVGDFTWSPLKTPVIPKRGRVSIDVVPYVMANNGGKAYRRRLSSFDAELAKSRENFLIAYGNSIPVEHNCPELLSEAMINAHNALYDAINTYLLWVERVWRKKLV